MSPEDGPRLRSASPTLKGESRPGESDGGSPASEPGGAVSANRRTAPRRGRPEPPLDGVRTGGGGGGASGDAAKLRTSDPTASGSCVATASGARCCTLPPPAAPTGVRRRAWRATRRDSAEGPSGEKPEPAELGEGPPKESADSSPEPAAAPRRRATVATAAASPAVGVTRALLALSSTRRGGGVSGGGGGTWIRRPAAAGDRAVAVAQAEAVERSASAGRQKAPSARPPAPACRSRTSVWSIARCTGGVEGASSAGSAHAVSRVSVW